MRDGKECAGLISPGRYKEVSFRYHDRGKLGRFFSRFLELISAERKGRRDLCSNWENSLSRTEISARGLPRQKKKQKLSPHQGRHHHGGLMGELHHGQQCFHATR